ncbi:toxin glutamine deamidase domain-containing protein [Actinomadura sp. WMMA1423]|uniref:toxin glutamine deamidase domain-containing protein n=1 Tax=Actinomadura sp. WMMA1423 TaxID=2591108 RepID=UPI00114651DD|nr:toxin glutamine deamidase domain-containing protein [Actinomadura sp. WMMA1423]
MGIERPSGTDTRVESADEPQGRDRSAAPPPERPGQPGTPSRLESLRAAREDQLARAAENRETPTRESGTEQRDDGEDNDSESLREEQQEPGETDTADDRREPDTEIGESDREPTADEERDQAEETEVSAEDPNPPSGEEAAKDDSGSREPDPETSRDDLPDERQSPPSAPSPETAEKPDPPSRLESLRAAREAQEARAAEPEVRQAPPPEPGTDQRLEPESTKSPFPVPTDAQPGPTANGEATEEPVGESSDTRMEQSEALPEATGESGFDAQAEIRDRDSEEGAEQPAMASGSGSEIDRQADLGKELARLADQKVDDEIDRTLPKVNPKFDWSRSDYSENCTSVVQANELRRRGHGVEAGPLEKPLRSDQNGPGGRDLSVIEQAWGANFTSGTKAEIEEAFKQPGSRGIVYIAWNGVNTGAHVFSVENVGGRVRFVDGQPKPPIRDAAHYFTVGHSTKYLRVDDLPTPSSNRIDPFLEP